MLQIFLVNKSLCCVAVRGGVSAVSYAGLLSVGVGDSVASLVGRRYGRHQIPGGVD